MGWCYPLAFADRALPTVLARDETGCLCKARINSQTAGGPVERWTKRCSDPFPHEGTASREKA